MRINVPNQITIGRVILTIIFFVLLARYHQRSPQVWVLDVCLALFVIAALSDILDGYLARKQNQVTSLGRVLDPFADKVLVCGAFVFFASPAFVDETGRNVTDVEAWMVVVILGRELLVTGLRGFTEARGSAFAATLYGKAKMVVQSVTAVAVLAAVGHSSTIIGGEWLAQLKTILVWLTVAVTAASTVAYLARAKNVLLETSRP